MGRLVRRLGNGEVGLAKGVGQLGKISCASVRMLLSSRTGFGSWALETFTRIKAVSDSRNWAIIELTSARARLIN